MPRSLGCRFFMNKNRERIKAENPEASFGELGKLAGAALEAMDAEAKAEYGAPRVPPNLSPPFRAVPPPPSTQLLLHLVSNWEVSNWERSAGW